MASSAKRDAKKKRAKKGKTQDLPASKAAAVKGGAVQAYLSSSGQKQGKLNP